MAAAKGMGDCDGNGDGDGNGVGVGDGNGDGKGDSNGKGDHEGRVTSSCGGDVQLGWEICSEFRGILQLFQFWTFWTPEFSSEFYFFNRKMCSRQF
jgi:hypothetical protein